MTFIIKKGNIFSLDKKGDFMKLTKIFAVTMLTGTLLLAGCQQKQGGEGSGSEPTQQSTPASEGNYLTFLNANQMRFDFFGDLGLSFKYGNEAIVDKNPFTLSVDKLTVNGTPKVDYINLIIVCEDKAGAGFSVAVMPEIEAASLGELLSDFGETYIKGYEGGKAYVAVSDGSNSKKPEWTKGLNAELDKKIQERIDDIK